MAMNCGPERSSPHENSYFFIMLEVYVMRSRISTVALILCASLCVASCQSKGSDLKPPADSDVAAATLEGKNVRLISIGELRAALDTGEAILIDVRSERQYREGHIKGALLLPKREIEARLRELPPDKLLVSYCACPAEHLSIAAALEMRQLGHQNVAALAGGLRVWLKEGLPTESGP